MAVGYRRAQPCPTFCDHTDCSMPGSSVHGISQARILEWVAFPSPGDLPHPGMELMSLESPAHCSPPQEVPSLGG